MSQPDEALGLLMGHDFPPFHKESSIINANMIALIVELGITK